MVSLQRLSLGLNITCPDVTDPLDLVEQLTSGLRQLHSFNLFVVVTNRNAQLSRHLRSDDEQRQEKLKRYGQVCDLVNRSGESAVQHFFTLPAEFTSMMQLGRDFPETRFRHVVLLWVSNEGPFDHGFFVRVARCFPVLRLFHVEEGYAELEHPADFHRPTHPDQVIEFPLVDSLHLYTATRHGIEQMLNENLTRLPRLARLTIISKDLSTVTQNFTRQETRRNCARVTELITYQVTVGTEDYHEHFPSLYPQLA